MKLIITDSIRKTEFEPLKKSFDLEVIKSAAIKSLKGLGDNIKNSFKIPTTTLSKIYLTGPGAPGRAVFLLKIDEKKSVLVMIRLKKDKKIGANITIKNPQFQKLLEKNLDLILTDIEKGKYTEHELN